MAWVYERIWRDPFPALYASGDVCADRDKDKMGIDVLIIRDGRVHPVEIKKTARPGRDAIRHLSVLGNLGLKVGHGAVICLTNEALPVTALVDAIPAWQIA